MAIGRERIAIIGCGWLGFPLSQIFVTKSLQVLGSTTSRHKVDVLRRKGVEAFVLDIYESDPDKNQIIPTSDVVIINIPPGRQVIDVESRYPEGIDQLLDRHPWMTRAYIVFVSSSGVYANTGVLACETSKIGPTKPSSRGLVTAEEIIRTRCEHHVVLRLSGLVGPKREPGRWFAGRTDLPGGDTPVNMIHLEDCLSIIALLIETKSHGIYNACAPNHPSKRDFYKAQAVKIGLEPPSFIAGTVPHKIVDHTKLVKDLAYTYKYPSPVSF